MTETPQYREPNAGEQETKEHTGAGHGRIRNAGPPQYARQDSQREYQEDDGSPGILCHSGHLLWQDTIHSLPSLGQTEEGAGGAGRRSRKHDTGSQETL